VTAYDYCRIGACDTHSTHSHSAYVGKHSLTRDIRITRAEENNKIYFTVTLSVACVKPNIDESRNAQLCCQFVITCNRDYD